MPLACNMIKKLCPPGPKTFFHLRYLQRNLALKTNLVRGTVSWGCDDLEEDVEPEVVGQVGLGRHEDDHDRRRDPEDEPAAEQVTQVAVQ